MTRSTTAHRPEFTVRCACGIEYHTSDEHIGRELPCKCGRVVKIVRPAEEKASTAAVLPGEKRPVKRERKIRRSQKSSSKATTTPTYEKYRRAIGWKRRTSILLADSLRPLFFGKPSGRLLAVASWGYLLGVVVMWTLLRFASESSVPGTMIAYGPRWWALLPLAVLVPVSLLASRAMLIPQLIAAWLCLWPIMGFRISVMALFARSATAPPASGTFRVMTFNADGSGALAQELGNIFRRHSPDIVTFQECNDPLWESLAAQPGWHTARYGALCTGSRWPIVDIQQMPREEFARISSLGAGGTALVMRTVLASPHGTLMLINLHLETARKGLEGMLGSEGFIPDHPLSADGWGNFKAGWQEPGTNGQFSANANIRRLESHKASTWVSNGIERNAIMIAGDFNLPVESTIFRENWSHFTDAFEQKGNGLGWSKREGRWLRIRIDHILTNDAGPKPLRAQLGPEYYSDHLPVIADFAWRN